MASAHHAGRSVLVVEDDPDIQQTLAFALQMAGYTVTLAGDGAEAMRHMRSALPCLVLLDLVMPVMDGWQFRAAQQQDPTLAAVPVVVLSADGRVRQKATTLGVAGYLEKPIDLDALLAAVRRHC
ncbi:MAG TPA: response regulator [Thermodesulfobacteriota bacterium]